MEICVTAQRPEHVITRSWVGTDAILGTEATGECDPLSDERIHIVLGTPHMHLKGKVGGALHGANTCLGL